MLATSGLEVRSVAPAPAVRHVILDMARPEAHEWILREDANFPPLRNLDADRQWKVERTHSISPHRDCTIDIRQVEFKTSLTGGKPFLRVKIHEPGLPVVKYRKNPLEVIMEGRRRIQIYMGLFGPQSVLERMGRALNEMAMTGPCIALAGLTKEPSRYTDFECNYYHRSTGFNTLLVRLTREQAADLHEKYFFKDPKGLLRSEKP